MPMQECERDRRPIARGSNGASRIMTRAAAVMALAVAVASADYAEGLAGGGSDSPFPRGQVAVGFQRATWRAWGPSIMIDGTGALARLVSVEAVFGFVPNWDMWSNSRYDAYAVRGYLRPLLLGRNDLYLAGMIGNSSFIEVGGGEIVEGRCLIFGAYAGAELDLRTFGAGWPPICLNAEGGYEYKTGYAYPYGYPTFGLGLRYWLWAR